MAAEEKINPWAQQLLWRNTLLPPQTMPCPKISYLREGGGGETGNMRHLKEEEAEKEGWRGW